MAAQLIHSPKALAGYTRLVLFGGSFDPPHWAHVRLPRHVRAKLDAEAVVYLPAAQSPHKLDREPTPASHRLAMLEAAETNDALILPLELDRAEAGEPSYTVDTLEQLRGALGDEPILYLLIGSDQVPVFEQWHKADRIAQLATPLAMVRPPQTKASLLASLPKDTQKRWADRILDVPAIDISATQVRERAAEGQPIADLVPEGVAKYICEHDLYRA